MKTKPEQTNGQDDRDAGAEPPSVMGDMGDEDAGLAEPSASTAVEGGVETRSCCAAHSAAGCDNPDLEACVCDKLPSCCSESWSAACTYIVAQKYCQVGIRECVCGSDEGQWQQTSCCDRDWTETCNTVAELKCNAVAGCN